MSGKTSGSADPHDGFREVRFGPWLAVVSSPLVEPVVRALTQLGVEKLRDLHDLDLVWSQSEGRGRNAILALPETTTRLHLRPLLHGGALRHLTGARFRSLARPLEEQRVTFELARGEAPVPQPGFVIGRRDGLFWQAAVATELIEDARDGVAMLEAESDVERLGRAVRAAARAVRTFHDKGGRHADLHIKNLLLRRRGEEFEAWIVDLDRARIEVEVSPKRRMAELMRLHRSLRKRNLRSGLDRETTRSFFEAYLAKDEALRKRMLENLRFERLRNDTHALFHSSR